MPVPKFTSLNDLTEYLGTQEERLSNLEKENKALTEFIRTQVPKTSEITAQVERSLPQTGLLRRSFLGRAFAVWGHYFVAQLIIALIIGLGYAIIFIVILGSIGR